MYIKIQKIIFSPLFWAILITILVFLFSPDFFKKYILTVRYSEFDYDKKVLYEDMDSDGLSEKILTLNRFGYNSIVFYNNNDSLLGQMNLEKKFTSNELIKFEDYNNDGFKELYFLTISSDSIFLNAIDYTNLSNFFLKDIFITKVRKNHKNNYDIGTNDDPIAVDLNGDGFKEIIFYISGGYSFSPRRIYAYDILKDSLISSPKSGANIFPPTIFKKEDNQHEIYFSTFATDNYKSTYGYCQYPDTSAWLMVLDNELNYLFPPIEFPERGSVLQVSMLQYNDANCYVALHSSYTETKITPVLYLFNREGQLKKKKNINDFSSEKITLVERQLNTSKIYLLDKMGYMYILNNKLELEEKFNVVDVSSPQNITVNVLDINNDGEKEYVFSHQTGLTVTDNRFQNSSFVKLENLGFSDPCIINTKEGKTYLWFKTYNNSWYKIEYSKNEKYFLKYFFFGGVFFVIFVFVYILMTLRTANFERIIKERTQEIIRREEELQRLNQQMFASNLKIDQQNIEVNRKNQEIKVQKDELVQKTVDLLVLNRELRINLKLREGLTNMIVHDLKNPISNILNLSENREVSFFASEILTLVENILDIQKYEGTLMPLKKTSVSINKIVIDAIKQISLFAERKNIEIQNNIDSSIIIYADEDILRRVIVNFLSNSIKYSYANGLIILDFEMQNNNNVLIKIIDFGIGINKDKIKLIFNKFSQIIAKKTGAARSTGLGLTFCKMAVKAHGGRIEVESEPDQFTSFSFNIEMSKNKPKNTLEIKDLSKRKEVNISEDDKIYLNPFYNEFNKCEVYEIGKLRKTLKKIDQSYSKNVDAWKKELNQAIYNCNYDLYKELINKLN